MPLLLLLLVLVVNGVMVLRNGADGAYGDALAPVRWYALGSLLFCGAVPLYHLASGSQIHTHASYTSLLLMSLLASVAYGLGWSAGSRRGSDLPVAGADAAPRRESSIALVCLGLGLSGTALFIYQSGGIGAFLAGVGSPLEQIGLERYNIVCLLVAQYVPAIGLSLHALRRNRHAILNCVILVIGLGSFLLVSMKLGSRTRMLYGLITCLWFLGWLRTRFHLCCLLLVGVLALELVVAFSSVRRGRMPVRDQWHGLLEVLRENGVKRSGLSALGGAEFDAFENGLDLVQAMDTEPALLGASFISAAVNPIPRSLWRGKPTVDVVGPMRRTRLGKGAVDNANVAVSFVAELYANFRWGGPVVVPFVFGWMSRRLWCWLLVRGSDPLHDILRVVLATFSFVVCRGSLTIMYTIALMCGFIPACVILLRRARGNVLISEED